MRRCSVAQCTRPHSARGFCAMHYQRFLKYGDPERLVRFPARHGTTGMYVNHGCRCAKCRAARAASHYAASVAARRAAAAGTIAVPHGTENGYSYYGCRCADCRSACRQRQARNRAS